MHLKNIEIENFRVFADRAKFEFRPITILTGKNNSGKSSLNKFLTLLKDNSENRNGLDYLHFSSLSGLKSYANSLSWYRKSKGSSLFVVADFPIPKYGNEFRIELEYETPRGEQGNLKGFKIFRPSDNQGFVSFRLHHEFDHETGTSYHQLKWNFGLVKELVGELVEAYKKREDEANKIQKEKPQINFSSSLGEFAQSFDKPKNNLFENFDKGIDDYRGKYNLEGKIAKEYSERKLLFDYYNIDEETVDLSEIQQIREIEDKYMSLEIRPEMTHDMFPELDLEGCIDHFFFHFDVMKSCETMVENHVKIFFDSPEIEVKKNNLLEFIEKELIQRPLKDGFNNLNKKFRSISHLSATRGNQSRLFSDSSQSSEIEAIVREYSESFPADFNFDRDITVKFINRQLANFGLDGELKIERIENLATLVYFKTEERKILLSDLGFGYSQLLPIILKIALVAQKNRMDDFTGHHDHFLPSIFILEEPEANLHPDFQSKISDILLDAASNFNMQFIIETHSEYLIRKLQYLTAKKEINPSDTVIYYFNNPKLIEGTEEKQIKRINILKTGGLDDNFGSGFYDEAINLQFDLLKLNQAQEN